MSLLLLYFFFAAVPSCWSMVSAVYPTAEQLPPVARVNEFFSWSISPDTFESSEDVLNYTASSLPRWLSFDPYSLTLFGTPSAEDEGDPEVMITASDSTSSVSSVAILCVTSYPPPILNIPIEEQFYSNNPSLSSVFPLSPGSAIKTESPALRVPPGWSFSIGLQWDTFTAANSLYYAARQANGSVLPDWIWFNPGTVTFDGVVPEDYTLWSPQIVSLALHASDQEGYTALSALFDLVIADDELWQGTESLPTINITASTPFNLTLSSPADYTGIFVNGKALQPSNISSLSIDTSLDAWLTYDGESRTLSGDPPANLSSSSPLLAVVLTAMFNQTLYTNVSLAVVPSYFSSPILPTLASGSGNIDFDLVQYFSNATPGNEANLTAAFDPNEAGNYLTFDPEKAQLNGTIPADFSVETGSNVSHITVTFTAYSYLTHSTSHTTLPVALSVLNNENKGMGHSHLRGLSAAAHARLVLGLEIAFGLVGGLVALGVLLAAFRRCARVEDTALGGEEGRSAWTDSDRKWYGINRETGGIANKVRGYTGTEKAEMMGRSAMELPSQVRAYGGLGLQGGMTQNAANPRSPGDLGSQAQIPGAVMRKAEFFGKIKETMRHVSDKYTRGRSGSGRPVIGKPVLITPADGVLGLQDEVLPFEALRPGEPPSSRSYEDTDVRSYAESTLNSLSDSPTASTEGRSIPRRRADFVPPRSPTAHFECSSQEVLPDDLQHARTTSTDSIDSLGSNASARNHAAEAVVQTAARATSVRSMNGPGVPYQSVVLEPSRVPGERPRLVPFTSATRVPVPRLPSSSLAVDRKDVNTLSGVNKRIASQTAKVMEAGADGSLDDLSIGMHYVRSLGGDQQARNSAAIYRNGSTPTVSTNVRSSFSSLESSRHGHGFKTGGVKRMLVRVGERFKFRVNLEGDLSGRPTEISLISGRVLPEFLQVDLKGACRPKGVVVFYGVPAMEDIGEANVGVYTSDDGECVGRVIVEVVGRAG